MAGQLRDRWGIVLAPTISGYAKDSLIQRSQTSKQPSTTKNCEYLLDSSPSFQQADYSTAPMG